MIEATSVTEAVEESAPLAGAAGASLETLDERVTFWRQRLSGIPVLELPLSKPRQATQSSRRARHALSLPAALSETLNALCRREETTLDVALVAALKALLLRYTGQTDFAVAAPVVGHDRDIEAGRANRPRRNHLVLCTDLSGDPSFLALLGRVRGAVAEALAHEVPFERLAEELRRGPSGEPAGYTPLPRVAVTLEDTPPTPHGTAGDNLNSAEAGRETEQFDLRLEVVWQREGLSCVFDYDAGLLEAGTVERMAGHLRTLLQGAVADPQQSLSRLPLLTEPERRQLTEVWNDTRVEYPDAVCLHQLFEEQAEKRPDAVAVCFKEMRVTYGELNLRADLLARHLRSLGVGREVLVGICAQRSVEMVLGILATLKAGGAYVPLDPGFPQSRLAFMLDDTRAPVLLTQQRLVGLLPEYHGKVVCMDADFPVGEGPRRGEPFAEATPDNLAYVIYTSGSTGQPKGIALRHQGVVNNITDLNRSFAVGPEDAVLAMSSLSFDMCVYEILGTLGAGGTIVVPEPALERDPAHWAELVRRHRVTVWNSAPSLLKMFVDYVTHHPELRPDSLRLALLGGDWVPVTLPDQLRALSEGAQVIVMGGATEASIHSVIYPVEECDPAWRSIPYGRPMANQLAYILDAQMQFVPVGVPGELHLGGVGLARGYYNRPALTSEKFVPHPFGREAGERLYKTGDLARYLPDSNIELLGRMDFQVKIRGLRIELGEVVAALRRHPSVEEAVAVVREDQPGNKRLVAYVVPANGPAPATPELRDFLKKSLPEYMVPAAFVPLEALPLSPNGKIDRRALPAPEQFRREAGAGPAASPGDAFELRLARIWEELLGVRPVGAEDNFFELGGDSIVTVELFLRIEKTFGKNLPVATLLQNPTLRQLADVLRREEWAAPWSSLVAIQPHGSRPPFFYVHGQGGNIVMHHTLAPHLEPDQPFYGLQSRGLDGKEPPLTRIEEMAAHYVEEVRSVQPEGPYYIGGFCSGALVALEMAQQLRRQGQEVPLLALIDPNTYFRGEHVRKPKPFRKLLYHIVGNLDQNLDDLERQGRSEYAKGKVTAIKKLIKRPFWRTVNRYYPHLLNQRVRTNLKVWRANIQAEKDYVPRAYAGRITIFICAKNYEAHDDTRLSFCELAAEGAEVHLVSGTHLTMMSEPHVRVLARKLTESLHKAQAATPGGHPRTPPE